MKRKSILSFLPVMSLLIALLIPSPAFAASEAAADDAKPEITECVEESSKGIDVNYYITGYAYGYGISRISYYVTAATIVVSGPTGTLTTMSVTGMGYFDVVTQPGYTYTASAPGYPTSTWTSY